jgi:S-adenosylmethionine uptake transporter
LINPATKPPGLIDNTQAGVLLAILAYGIMAGQDATVKWLAADYSVWQILFVRSLTVALISISVGGRRGISGVIRSRRKGDLLLRAGLTLTAWVCYYTASRQLGLADLVTLYYAAPIFVTILSIVMLKEKVTWIRWTSVIVGFVGVIIAANPTGRPELWPALLVLLAAMLWGFSSIMVRQIMHAEPTINQMIFGNSLFALVCAFTLPWTWQQPNLFDFGLMLAFGCGSGIGQYLIYESFRRAPASVLAPTEYTALVWAVILGYLIWHDLPTVPGIIGACLIVLASIIVMVGERRKKVGI